MRTHSKIVKAATATLLAEQLDASINTVRSWQQRGSIPSEHWASLIANGHATAEELIAGAPKRAPSAAAA